MCYQQRPVAKKNPEPLNCQIVLRISEEGPRRIDALGERFPVTSKHALTRATMRFGLDFVEEDPTGLLKLPAPKRGRGIEGARIRAKKKGVA